MSLSVLLLSCCFIEVHAKDFGVQGQTWEIAEENILQVIERKLAKLDVDALNNEMADKVKSYVAKPPKVTGLVKVKKFSTIYYDPSYILDRDIVDHKERLIHAKGIKVNPLEQVPLREALVFIDGDDKEQVEYALKAYKKLKGSAKIILTNGAPLELQKKHKVWMYFDQQGKISSQLGITAIPALVTQDGLRLKIVMGMEEGKKDD
jgi:conjugal transfer pilus assembly protein TraW